MGILTLCNIYNIIIPVAETKTEYPPHKVKNLVCLVGLVRSIAVLVTVCVFTSMCSGLVVQAQMVNITSVPSQQSWLGLQPPRFALPTDAFVEFDLQHRAVLQNGNVLTFVTGIDPLNGSYGNYVGDVFFGAPFAAPPVRTGDTAVQYQNPGWQYAIHWIRSSAGLGYELYQLAGTSQLLSTPRDMTYGGDSQTPYRLVPTLVDTLVSSGTVPVVQLLDTEIAAYTGIPDHPTPPPGFLESVPNRQNFLVDVELPASIAGQVSFYFADSSGRTELFATTHLPEGKGVALGVLGLAVAGAVWRRLRQSRSRNKV